MINIPTPLELKKKYPLQDKEKEFIESTRSTIKNILDEKDPRLLLIVGPCSIHDITAAKEYATKLRDFAKEVEDRFFVIMRVYFEKPRTSLGWKGLIQDPLIDSSNKIDLGLEITRKLLLDIAEMGLPAACEFLHPTSNNYFGDLISWSCIGARTTTSQIHREMASGLQMPIAFKNSTDGNIENAINGIKCAYIPQTYLDINEHGMLSVLKSKGNKYAHIVLRGSEETPNYDPQSINKSLELLKKAHMPERVLIDCSHGNSMRRFEEQINVFQSVIHQIRDGNKNIRGLLLESNLFAGNQCSLNPMQYGVSITDACLDWNSTKRLIKWGCELLTQENTVSQSPQLQHNGICG